MKELKQILFSLIILLIYSCNHLEEGTVLRKEYEHKRIYTQFITVTTGKICSIVPYIIIDNEDFILIIEGRYNGEIIQEQVYVTEKCYNSIKIGEKWVNTEDCSFDDLNNSKSKKQ